MEDAGIGILGWELTNRITLSQLEAIPGDIAHPDTFSFPVKYVRVKGCHYKTIVEAPDEAALEAMIKASQQLEREGVRGIITNCGFNAIFHKELSNAVFVPLISSSLTQVPLVHAFLKKECSIGIITADKRYLSEKHLSNVGIDQTIPIQIIGLEDSEEFSKIRHNSVAVFNVDKFFVELRVLVTNLVSKNKVGAKVVQHKETIAKTGSAGKEGYKAKNREYKKVDESKVEERLEEEELLAQQKEENPEKGLV